MYKHPKYLWYYAAALLLVYLFWNYYRNDPFTSLSSLSLFGNEDLSMYAPSKKLPHASLNGGLDGLYGNAANITKNITSSIGESMASLSDGLDVPNFQSNSLESSMIQNFGSSSGNLMSTPSYNLSKSHILLQKQLPPVA